MNVRKRFSLSWPTAMSPNGLQLSTTDLRVHAVPGFCPVSRREFMRIAGLGGVALTGLGSLPTAARAEPICLCLGFGACIVGFLSKFIPAVCAAIAGGLVLDRIRNAQYQPRPAESVPQHLHFHFQNAAPDRTDLVIPTTQGRAGNLYFNLREDFHVGTNRDLGSCQDLNKPELLRLTDEFPGDGAYRPVADAAGAVRRALTNRDRALFVATLRVYDRDGGLPRGSTFTPVYARELADARGRRFTGFGLVERSGRETVLNFLIATESSAS